MGDFGERSAAVVCSKPCAEQPLLVSERTSMWSVQGGEKKRRSLLSAGLSACHSAHTSDFSQAATTGREGEAFSPNQARSCTASPSLWLSRVCCSGSTCSQLRYRSGPDPTDSPAPTTSHPCTRSGPGSFKNCELVLQPLPKCRGSVLDL